jgi:catalase
MKFHRQVALAAGAGMMLALTAPSTGFAQDDKPLGVKLVDQFNTMFGSHPGFRANHAKGIVLEGSFTPSPKAASVTIAPHLQATPSKITIRFSDAAGIPDIPDTNPLASPRGVAIKFHLADGSETDLLGITLKGFPAGTGEDFLAFLKAAAASGPDAPKPTELQKFLAAHPNSAKIVTMPQPMPVSYGTVPYYGVDAFKFTNAKGKVQFGRYRIEPVGGAKYLSDAAAAKRSPSALGEELRAQLAKGPVKMKLLLQLAQKGDPTNDATQPWPDNRPTVELGVITISSSVPDSLTAEKALLFMPTNLTAGIEPSDDPLIMLRTEAYAESFGRRSQ